MTGTQKLLLFFFTAPIINCAKEPTLSSFHLTDSCVIQFNKPRRVWGTSRSSVTLDMPLRLCLVLGKFQENNINE